jgi:hypothetical protein
VNDGSDISRIHQSKAKCTGQDLGHGLLLPRTTGFFIHKKPAQLSATAGLKEMGGLGQRKSYSDRKFVVPFEVLDHLAADCGAK